MFASDQFQLNRPILFLLAVTTMTMGDADPVLEIQNDQELNSRTYSPFRNLLQRQAETLSSPHPQVRLDTPIIPPTNSNNNRINKHKLLGHHQHHSLSILHFHHHQHHRPHLMPLKPSLHHPHHRLDRISCLARVYLLVLFPFLRQHTMTVGDTTIRTSSNPRP